MTQNDIVEKRAADYEVNCTHYFEHFLPSVAQRSALADVPVEATIGLTISEPGGGQWSVTLGGGSVVVRRGATANADATYIVDKETFAAVVCGRLPPHDAFMAHRIEITGDLEKALLLAVLFGKLAEEFPYKDALTSEATDARPILA